MAPLITLKLPFQLKAVLRVTYDTLLLLGRLNSCMLPYCPNAAFVGR